MHTVTAWQDSGKYALTLLLFCFIWKQRADLKKQKHVHKDYVRGVFQQ